MQQILKVQTILRKFLLVCNGLGTRSTNHNTIYHNIHLNAIGPFESEDGKYMIGSLIMVYATRDEVDRFYTNDPFYIHNVWQQVLLFYTSIVIICTH
jgi:hypothetical protein